VLASQQTGPPAAAAAAGGVHCDTQSDTDELIGGALKM